jgi:hypothetical protein
MLWHGNDINVLLLEFPITNCGGEDFKVLVMISLEEIM